MGFLRLLKQAIIFGTRSRRLFIFIFIFAILSGVTLLAMDSIFQENTSELLTAKSIVLEIQNNLESNTMTVSNVDPSSKSIVQGYGSSYLVKYIKMDNMYLFSLSSNPWENPEVRPKDIKQGSYVSNFGPAGKTYQALASSGYSFNLSNGNSNGPYSFKSDTSVGNNIDFWFNNEIRYSLKIVGTFNKSTTLNEGNPKIWIFVPDDGFDTIAQLLYPQNRDANIYVSQIVLTASGSTEFFFGLFAGDANAKLTKISEGVDNTPIANFSRQTSTKLTDIRAAATQKDISLLFGGLGSTIVATLYAFIIARFRTREIATLKAVGYTARQVRVVLLAEIGTVSVIGYLLATFAIQILLTLNSYYTLGSTYIPNIWKIWGILDPLSFNWLPSSAATFTFIIIVLSNIIGFFIISRRTVTVRPVELFRADA
ncbi:MAG: hypothetical protein ACFFD1_12310 [Candidatus Thorarchaeota archaeon]